MHDALKVSHVDLQKKISKKNKIYSMRMEKSRDEATYFEKARSAFVGFPVISKAPNSYPFQPLYA